MQPHRYVMVFLTAVTGCGAPAAQQRADAPAPPEEKPAPVDLGQSLPLEACSGEIEHDTWTLTCPYFVVSRTLIHRDATWTEALLIKTTLASLREGAETVGTTSDRKPAPGLYADGGHGYAMTIVTGEGDLRQTFGMTTFARPFDSETIVGVICMDLEQTSTERCEEISLWFAGTVPQIEWVDQSRPIQLAGRLVAVPTGCEGDGDSTISCANGSELLWSEREADDSATAHVDEIGVVHRGIVRVNEERTGQEPTVKEDRFDCHIDGELGDCTLREYVYGSSVLYVLVAVGRVRGVDVAVLCDWTAATSDQTVPVPCSSLVTAARPVTKEL